MTSPLHDLLNSNVTAFIRKLSAFFFFLNEYTSMRIFKEHRGAEPSNFTENKHKVHNLSTQTLLKFLAFTSVLAYRTFRDEHQTRVLHLFNQFENTPCQTPEHKSLIQHLRNKKLMGFQLMWVLKSYSLNKLLDQS